MKRTPPANAKFYKGLYYTYSPIRGCWKIYHSSCESFMLMDFKSESEVKSWINLKTRK